MTFTDEDLKQLKEDLGINPIHKGEWINYDIQKLLALLARLEAAEKVCLEVGEIQEWRWTLKKALEAWRKAAGRE